MLRLVLWYYLLWCILCCGYVVFCVFEWLIVFVFVLGVKFFFFFEFDVFW